MHLSVLSPLVLATNLLLLFRGEVICDVEGLADLLRRLALDHVGNRLAANVKKRLDVEVVGSLASKLVSIFDPSYMIIKEVRPFDVRG